ncbi:hypothetical protein [uncultured Sulfitobacter sp.]|uniref:hypothetical protein n=1 Tax=uncultured Sulfitobacter sp. TaxID=191468 RepID=UPI00260BC9AB|nr:hypothetical protein [uncultured Sulfitobacter sp.]
MSADTTNILPQPKITRLEKLKERVKVQTGTIEFRVMTVVLTALMLWGAAIATFGYPALIIVALTLVPVIFFLLMMITVGK